MYSLISDDGFCRTLSSDGIGGVLQLWDLHGLVFLLSFIALMYWARLQILVDSTGFFSPKQLTIFPIHMKLLMFLGATALFQGVMLAYFSAASITSGQSWAVGNGLSYGLSHILLDGIAVLLLCSGIGLRALRMAFATGFIIGVVAGLSKYFAEIADRPDSVESLLFNFGWECLLLFFYSLAWMMPRQRWMRRPAAIYWARYWTIFRAINIFALALEHFSCDVGWCLYHINVLMLFAVGKCFVTYQSFLLEARFWHGVEVEGYGLCASCIPRNAATEGGPVSVNAMFTDLPLTSESALAMSNAADAFEFSQSNDQVSGVRSSRAFDRWLCCPSRMVRGNEDMTFGAFVDFSKLVLLPDRLLGAGSTARVYEGRLCGRACAVKVLFTVEILPEEIQRTCKEAALLHRLQDSSIHVVKLIGVAMLPPSLCVVLEICSEGSLSEVIYKQFDTRASRDSRNSRGSQDSRRGRPASFLTAGKGYAYALTWQDSLDLALGVSRGLAAFVKVLPMYSHNDLTSSNILVHKPEYAGGGSDRLRFIAKIADCEYASKGITPRHMHCDETPNWAAPEVLAGISPVSAASDVFSLGCVLFEIASREVPLGEASSVQGFNTIAKHIIAGQRAAFPRLPAVPEEADSRSRLYAIINRAWAAGPNDRPTASEIADTIKQIRCDYASAIEITEFESDV